MSEKLCLRWNDFQDNIKSAFGNFREDNDFADVTLVCNDGQQVEAHKVILAASSPFFKTLLSKNKHPHPLIYMRRVNYNELAAIMDFLYLGEANVFQDDLDSFLAIAEELKLKGLLGKPEDNINEKPLPLMSSPHNAQIQKASPERHSDASNGINDPLASTDTKLAIPGDSIDLGELDDKVKSMMEKSQNKIANGTKTS